MAINPKDLARHYFSLEEYFALEHVGDARYEYWNGDIYCMSGGTRWHSIIISNVHTSLGIGLRGGPCRVLTAELPIYSPALPPYRYADVSVACGELEFKTIEGMDALVNPVVIVEVLSPSTAMLDHGPKFTIYQSIPTLREYLVIAQDEARVTHYTRLESGAWQRRDITDLDESLILESINWALSMRDVYDGVTFQSELIETVKLN